VFAFEASKMVGKFGRLAEEALWAKHWVSPFNTSTSLALTQNIQTVSTSSPGF
jgi:hypothetical protein